MAEQKKTPRDAPELDAFFAAARDSAPEVSDDLFAAIMSDAAGARPAPAPRREIGILNGVRDLLGGWRSLAGLGTAAAAGLVLGIYTPAPFTMLETGFGDAFVGAASDVAVLDGYDLEDMMPGFETLSQEGWP